MDLTQQVKARQALAHHSPAPDLFPHHMLPTNAALWDALTKPERLATWFAPVSGGLRTNGRYSITGNASGGAGRRGRGMGQGGGRQDDGV
ncbi:hypothetical protein MY1884_001879 [Beauveria asiatica]